MTMYATRDGQSVTVHGNNGVDVEIRNSRVQGVHVTEDAQHIRQLWSSLGRLLDEADHERAEAVQ